MTGRNQHIGVRHFLCAWGLVLGSCDGSTPTPPADTASPWFEDVAQSSGLDFRHVRALEQRFWFPEIVGAGLGWLDYDGDGRIDLFCVQSGDLEPGDRPVPGCKLFRNMGDGRFADVTEKAGVGAPGYGMGCTTGDYDGDGDVDLYVTRHGPNVLYRNEGNGTFTDVTAHAGVGHDGWGTSCGFVDCDADGDLDLVVVNYVRWSKERELPCKSAYGERDYCAPNNYNAPARTVLYVNDGQGRFRDGTVDAGISTAVGNGLGLALADFDGDERVDIYVSNDGMPNQLWINKGSGKFVDEAVVRCCAVNCNGSPQASMGTVTGDFDTDGDVDLFITNLRGESNVYYDNDGKGRMSDITARTGLAGPSLQFTGWGDAVVDFDHDGFTDVFVANGGVSFWKPYFSEEDVYAQPKHLYRGVGGKRFEPVPNGGLASDLLGNSRGVAVADYDDDGDLDVAVNENNGRVRLLRNIATKRGHWIEMSVRNKIGAPALGARVEIVAGGKKLLRWVAVCSSYASANDPRVHCGLGAAGAVESVDVRWPDGSRETFGPLAVDKIHDLQQGKGQRVR